MTALKPIENRRVRGVAAERYPLNEVCAHPSCKDPAVDPHHIFPRSMINGDSWFVEISNEGGEREKGAPGFDPIPHVTGLCRVHHDDVEEHRAWIKLEDGGFVWYVRKEDDWLRRGALNPQPPGKEGKPKRAVQRPRKTGAPGCSTTRSSRPKGSSRTTRARPTTRSWTPSTRSSSATSRR
jgi:hypothetical protein